MRRQFLNNPPPRRVVLSVEEEAVLADEFNEVSAAVDDAGADLVQVGDISAGINDTVSVTSDLEKITPVEQQLIASVGDMAVAGTDADGAEVVGVATAEVGQVSAEGFVDSVKSGLEKIWKAICAGIDKLFNWIKSWFVAYHSTAETGLKNAEKLLEVLESKKEITKSKVIVTVDDYFGYNENNILGGNLVTKNAAGLDNLVSRVMSAQPDFIDLFANQLVHSYDMVAKDNGQELEEYVDVLHNSMRSYLKKLDMTYKNSAGDATSEKFAGTYIKAVGTASFTASDASAVKKGATEQKIADLTKVKFSAHGDKRHGNVIDFNFGVSPQITKIMIDDLKVIIDDFKKLIAFKADYFQKMEKTAAKVKEAGGKMLKDVKAKGDPKVEGDGGVTAKGAKGYLPLAAAFSNWATQPVADLMNVRIRHNNWWVSLIKKYTAELS